MNSILNVLTALRRILPMKRARFFWVFFTPRAVIDALFF
jgi:hypothetical protein